MGIGENVALSVGEGADFVAIAFPVSYCAAGDAALLEVVGYGGNDWDFVEVEDGGEVAAFAHFGEVAEEAESGDVGHGGDAFQFAEGGAQLVEAGHAFEGDGCVCGLEESALLGGGEDANTEGFCEVEQATCGSGGILF